jgi:uncharacterized protein YoxC
MAEKTWDIIYDAIMDLTKSLNALNEKVDRGFSEISTNLERVEDRIVGVESDLTFIKLKLFETDKELQYLKQRRA